MSKDLLILGIPIILWAILGVLGYMGLFFLERKKGYRNYRYAYISDDLRLTVPFHIQSCLRQILKGGLFTYLVYREFKFHDNQNRTYGGAN